MKLAYLLNSYPMTSTTFIRREIEALESLGQPVTRFSVRHWDTALVDPDDIAEQDRTEYLLTGNITNLLTGALSEPLRNPTRFARAARLARRVHRAAGASAGKHVNYLLQAIYLRRRAKALGIDHIHAHFSTNAATVAMLAHALGGPSYSFTVHGPDELVDPTKNAMALKVAEAAFVVAITDYCKSRIAEVSAPADHAKINVIRCGIDLADFTPDPAEPGEMHRFVCVGRLCHNKAQELFPAAVAAVRDEFPDVRIDLVGDGDTRPLIEAEMKRLGVEDNIRLLGWGTAPQVRDRIRAASALLLPSLAEGLPIVLMEALALERPVLTTRIAGIPELVDDGCGWIFEPGSVEQLTDALRDALRTTRDRLAAKANEGRRRVEEHHDVHISAALLQQAFEAAAASVGAAPNPSRSA